MKGCHVCGDNNCDGSNRITLTLLGMPAPDRGGVVDTTKHMCYARLPLVPKGPSEEREKVEQAFAERVRAHALIADKEKLISAVSTDNFVVVMQIFAKWADLMGGLTTAMGLDCDGMTGDTLSMAMWFMNQLDRKK
jgi:hypothetical protein